MLRCSPTFQGLEKKLSRTETTKLSKQNIATREKKNWVYAYRFRRSHTFGSERFASAHMWSDTYT
jgi:hypothetical protein